MKSKTSAYNLALVETLQFSRYGHGIYWDSLALVERDDFELIEDRLDNEIGIVTAGIQRVFVSLADQL